MSTQNKFITALVGCLVLVALYGVGGQILNEDISYAKPITIETEVVIEVEALEAKITQALEDAEGEIEMKSQEAYAEERVQLEKEVELEVVRSYNLEVDEREIQLEKEVGAY